MKIQEIRNKKATIEIDGDEMIMLLNALRDVKKPSANDSVLLRLINDISALYEIAVYSKIPIIGVRPLVRQKEIELLEGAEE